MNKPMKKMSDYFQCNPGPQQQAFNLLGKGNTIFYGGARGGGKSHLALMGAMWACKMFPGLRVGIIRRYFDELQENFISKMEQLFPHKLIGYNYRVNRKSAEFPNGSSIRFRSADKQQDIEKILGLEYQFLIFDEAPQFPEDTFHRASGSVRNAHVPNWKPTTLYTGNPGGMSQQYFKTRFIKPEYDKWETGELKQRDQYIFIQAKVSDNPLLEKNDPGYIEKLEALPDTLRRAWLDGDWDVFDGKFFEGWNPSTHIVTPFEIPEHWQKVAGLDLGYTEKHPTVCEWFAQNPETLDVYLYQEYVGHSKGSVETYANDLKTFKADTERIPIYADPSMWNSTTKTTDNQESPAYLMMSEGLPLMVANNSRINGWRMMKQWLHYEPGTMPKLFVFNNCNLFIDTIGRLQYIRSSDMSKVEDLDTKGPDDAADASRYALMSNIFKYPTQSSVESNTFHRKQAEKVPDIDPYLLRDGINESNRDSNNLFNYLYEQETPLITYY